MKVFNLCIGRRDNELIFRVFCVVYSYAVPTIVIHFLLDF